MNPVMGIRELHAEGITGKGVTVAIIDQHLVPEHPEFQGKIVKYYDVGINKPAGVGSMHGPAVTSLMVGDNIGTAPDASVYYVAAPSWLEDAQYYADALEWIVAEDEKLLDGKKSVLFQCLQCHQVFGNFLPRTTRLGTLLFSEQQKRE